MPNQLSSRLDWEIANNLWASSLNPLISNPLNSVQILKNVELQPGVNVINHRLGHIMTGWFLVDLQEIAFIYRTAPFNSTTLVLTSNATVTCSIGVF